VTARGLSPAHFAINATLFLVAGLIVVADGYIVVGLLIVAFVAFAVTPRCSGGVGRQIGSEE
jgi:hypothetical protein